MLKISESGYYRWLKNCNKPTKQPLLLVEINAILAEHKDNDNYSVCWMYTVRSVRVIIRTVYRAIKTAGLFHKCRIPHGITKAQERENLIEHGFHADESLKKLLTDVTEIPSMDGKLYV